MDELEAAIRAALATRDRKRDPLAGPHGARDNEFVGEVLRAAEAYAAGDSDDVTLRRRQVLVRDGWRRVYDDHLQLPRLRRGPD